jgi:hypothetical protein
MIVLLGDVVQAEAHFDPFGDSFWCKIGALFALNVSRAWKSFWAHLIVVLGDVCHSFDLS